LNLLLFFGTSGLGPLTNLTVYTVYRFPSSRHTLYGVQVSTKWKSMFNLSL